MTQTSNRPIENFLRKSSGKWFFDNSSQEDIVEQKTKPGVLLERTASAKQERDHYLFVGKL